MRLLIISDLHLDFWAAFGRNPWAGLEHDLATLDHVIIAGDLTNKPKVRWKFALNEIRNAIPNAEISLFPGNHDFYDFRLDGEERLAEIARSFGVNYIQKAVLNFQNVRLLCATLWTDLELGPGSLINAVNLSQKMNDYKKIRLASGGYRRIHPSDTALLHKNHLAWLEDELAKPYEGKTWVVTHHAPHRNALSDPLSDVAAAYASDLDHIIEKYTHDRWYFGHTHYDTTFKIAKTEFINVSLGYPDDIDDPESRIRSLIVEL